MATEHFSLCLLCGRYDGDYSDHAQTDKHQLLGAEFALDIADNHGFCPWHKTKKKLKQCRVAEHADMLKHCRGVVAKDSKLPF
jgi:hypothetical protein